MKHSWLFLTLLSCLPGFAQTRNQIITENYVFPSALHLASVLASTNCFAEPYLTTFHDTSLFSGQDQNMLQCGLVLADFSLSIVAKDSQRALQHFRKLNTLCRENRLPDLSSFEKRLVAARTHQDSAVFIASEIESTINVWMDENRPGNDQVLLHCGALMEIYYQFSLHSGEIKPGDRHLLLYCLYLMIPDVVDSFTPSDDTGQQLLRKDLLALNELLPDHENPQKRSSLTEKEWDEIKGMLAKIRSTITG